MLDAYSLGFGDPIAVSAEHGLGIADVFDVIRAAMPPSKAESGEEAEEDEDAEAEAAPEKPLHIAIIGQPNAGKSTLVNRLLGKERMLTGPEAGITRDAIAVDWNWRGRQIRLADTAGIRRKAKVVEKLEQLSVGDAMKVIRFAEVVVLLMDASEPFEKQDLQLAALVADEGRALVLALNKWDLVADKDATLRTLRADLEETLAQVRGVPMVPISALSGSGIDKLMAAVLEVHATWNKRVPTAALNRWLGAMTERHPPPAVSGRRIKLKYLSQSKTRPPTFYLSCSRPEALPDAYRRYIVNGLREDFGLAGVPIRLMVRADANPYEGRSGGLSASRSRKRREALCREIEEHVRLRKTRRSHLDEMRHDLGRVRQRVGVFAGHRLGAHRRARLAGIDGDDADRGLLDLLGVGRGQRIQRRLGDGVGAPIGPAVVRRARGHEERAPGVALPKQRVERADEPPVRGDVDRHHIVPDLRRDVAERRKLAEDAGIGEEDVELLPALEDRRAEAVDAFEVLEVERHQRGGAAGRLDLVVEFLKTADRARNGDDMRAGRGEALGGVVADAARGAGDDGDAAFERLRFGHRAEIFSRSRRGD